MSKSNLSTLRADYAKLQGEFYEVGVNYLTKKYNYEVALNEDRRVKTSHKEFIKACDARDEKLEAINSKAREIRSHRSPLCSTSI